MKSARSILALSAGIGIVGIAAGLYFAFFGPDRMVMEGKSFQELLEGGEILTIGGVAVSLVIGGAVFWSVWRTMFPPDIKNGVTAQAKVLKVWDTGTTLNENPQIGLLLEVTPSMGAVFQAEAKTIVSRLQVALVQPGVAAEVKYDPQNPKRIRVLSIDVDSAAPSGAVARMEELNSLRDKGLITDQEYQEKREEILHAL